MLQLQMFLASPYYTALLAGIAVAVALAWRAARRDRVDPIAWATLLAAAAAGGLLGSKFLFFDLQPAAAGEKTILGGLLLGILVVLALAWLFGLGRARTLDRLTVPGLAAMAIGRVGCFFADCCLGVHSELLGHRHPTVLYEAALDVALLSVIAKRVPSHRTGLQIGVGVTGYSGIRFVTEFLRDRPEFGAGLNPVQWLMLLTLVGVGAWTVLRSRQAQPAPNRSAGARLSPFIAALVISISLIVAAVALTPWVVPPEQVVLLWIGFGLLVTALRTQQFAAVLRGAPRAALASAPAVGLYFLLQAPEEAAEPRRAKFTLGTRTWSSYYNRVAGQLPPVIVPGGCSYGGCDGTETCSGDRLVPGATVEASRSTRVLAATSSVQLPVEAPSQLALDAMVFVGSDVSSRPAWIGELSGVETVPIHGVGLALTTGEPEFLVRFGLMAGSLSRNGSQVTATTPNAMVRISGSRAFYFEGSAVDRKFLATHGDFSYFGVGYLHARSGTRVFWGGSPHGEIFSAGAVLGRRVELDVSQRTPTAPDSVPKVQTNWQLGLRYRFR